VSSISVTGNVGTATTTTNHSYVPYDVIEFSGANESVFNDSFEIIGVPTSTTFTFAITTADGSATGTIASKISPLGWTKPYTGTNKAVFRPSTGNQYFIRVDDTATRHSTINVYETMTTVDDGTGVIGPCYWKKSDTASTAARSWVLVGNSRAFYLCIAFASSYTDRHGINFFGDIISLKVNDIYNTALMGEPNVLYDAYHPSQYSFYHLIRNTASGGQFLIRNHLETGPVNFWKNSMSIYFGYGTSFSYPSPVNSGLHLHTIQIVEASGNNLRGYFPGLYAPLESTTTTFPHNDRTVVIAGVPYVHVRLDATNANYGGCFFSLGEWF
jgi:hypothetical protein